MADALLDAWLEEVKAERDRHMAEVMKIAYDIADSADPAGELDAVYAQFKMFRTAPDNYHLPDEYSWAEEAICGFDADDYVGFLGFARAILDYFDKRSDERRPIQAVYKKINAWAEGGRKRSLISSLEYGYQKTHGHLPAGRVKRDYIETILNRWKEERQDGLSALSQFGAVSHEERTEFLQKFWRTKSEEASEGKLPHWRVLLGETLGPTLVADNLEEGDESISEKPEALSETEELQALTGRAEAMALAAKTAIDASTITTEKAAKLAAMLVEMAGMLRDEILRL